MDMESQDPRFSANLGLDQNSIWTNNLRCSHSSSLPLKKNLAQSGQLPSSFLQTFGPGSQTEPATFSSGSVWHDFVWLSGLGVASPLRPLRRRPLTHRCQGRRHRSRNSRWQVPEKASKTKFF